MPRLSRQESQGVTRKKLIEATEKEILRVGIYEASIRSICEAAGFTLGAYYSNFIDKDELLLEVVQVQTERELASLHLLVAETSHLAESVVLEQVALWLQKLQKNKTMTLLSLEFEVYANHNPSFRKKYIEDKKRWHGKVAKALRALFEGQGVKPRIPIEQMAIGLSALWNGFAVERSVPNVDPVDKILPLFLEALLDTSKSPHKGESK